MPRQALHTGASSPSLFFRNQTWVPHVPTPRCIYHILNTGGVTESEIHTGWAIMNAEKNYGTSRLRLPLHILTYSPDDGTTKCFLDRCVMCVHACVVFRAASSRRGSSSPWPASIVTSSKYRFKCLWYQQSRRIHTAWRQCHPQEEHAECLGLRMSFEVP